MNDNLHPWIEPELEARIVALVLGEASDFEREELERLCEQRHEVAMFRKQMEDLHELLGESVREDPADGEWRMSSDRREALLASLGEETEMPMEVVPEVAGRVGSGRGNVRKWIVGIGAAACLAVGLFIILVTQEMNAVMSKAKSEDEFHAFGWQDRLDYGLSDSGVSSVATGPAVTGEEGRRSLSLLSADSPKSDAKLAVNDGRKSMEELRGYFDASRSHYSFGGNEPGAGGNAVARSKSRMLLSGGAARVNEKEMVEVDLEFPKPMFMGTPMAVERSISAEWSGSSSKPGLGYSADEAGMVTNEAEIAELPRKDLDRFDAPATDEKRINGVAYADQKLNEEVSKLDAVALKTGGISLSDGEAKMDDLATVIPPVETALQNADRGVVAGVISNYSHFAEGVPAPAPTPGSTSHMATLETPQPVEDGAADKWASSPGVVVVDSEMAYRFRGQGLSEGDRGRDRGEKVVRDEAKSSWMATDLEGEVELKNQLAKVEAVRQMVGREEFGTTIPEASRVPDPDSAQPTSGSTATGFAVGKTWNVPAQQQQQGAAAMGGGGGGGEGKYWSFDSGGKGELAARIAGGNMGKDTNDFDVAVEPEVPEKNLFFSGGTGAAGGAPEEIQLSKGRVVSIDGFIDTNAPAIVTFSENAKRTPSDNFGEQGGEDLKTNSKGYSGVATGGTLVTPSLAKRPATKTEPSTVVENESLKKLTNEMKPSDGKLKAGQAVEGFEDQQVETARAAMPTDAVHLWGIQTEEARKSNEALVEDQNVPLMRYAWAEESAGEEGEARIENEEEMNRLSRSKEEADVRRNLHRDWARGSAQGELAKALNFQKKLGVTNADPAGMDDPFGAEKNAESEERFKSNSREYDRTRSTMLRQVDELWEAEVPPHGAVSGEKRSAKSEAGVKGEKAESIVAGRNVSVSGESDVKYMSTDTDGSALIESDEIIEKDGNWYSAGNSVNFSLEQAEAAQRVERLEDQLKQQVTSLAASRMKVLRQMEGLDVLDLAEVESTPVRGDAEAGSRQFATQTKQKGIDAGVEFKNIREQFNRLGDLDGEELNGKSLTLGNNDETVQRKYRETISRKANLKASGLADDHPDVVALGESITNLESKLSAAVEDTREELTAQLKSGAENLRGFDFREVRSFTYPTEFDPPEEPAEVQLRIAQYEEAKADYDEKKEAKKALEEQLVKEKTLAAYIRPVTSPPLFNKVEADAALGETKTAAEPFSTFSLNVSDVSFKLAKAALAEGNWPDAERIRIEEFVNALDYQDPMPSARDRVACAQEQAAHPFLQQRNLLRLSMRTAAEGRAASTPLRLTLLLDASGSMERADRQQAVELALGHLATQLQPQDQVTLISFARRPRLVAEGVGGSEMQGLLQKVREIPSEGGTNLESALMLAMEKAKEQQDDSAQNRIILITDGAANLGDAKPENLASLIESMRNQGIAFDAAGIVADGLNDEILEALTRKGDGRYYLLDRPEDADARFAKQIAGSLRPAAKNVKVQVEFNPKRVKSYKLLGYEKHRLKKEDFRNDKVDAAEMAAEEAGVALYHFEADPGGEGDVGSVSVRFLDMATGQMVERRWPVPYLPNAPRLDEAADSMRLATVASMTAAKLKGDAVGGYIDWKSLSQFSETLSGNCREQKRVADLVTMIAQARGIAGE